MASGPLSGMWGAEPGLALGTCSSSSVSLTLGRGEGWLSGPHGPARPHSEVQFPAETLGGPCRGMPGLCRWGSLGCHRRAAWGGVGTRCEISAPAELGAVVLADIEEKGVRMKLTVIDTPGFGDHINNENW